MEQINLTPEEIRKYRLKKKKRKRGLLIALIVVLSVVVLLVVAVVAVFFRFYNRSNYIADSDLEGAVEEFINEVLPKWGGSDGNGEEIATVDEELEKSLIEENELTVDELDPGALDQIYNLLLVGVDRRDRSWNGNSDAMVLITINKKTHKIYMTSFLRDLYSNIEGVGIRKLNHAYAIGAGPLLVNTLQTNYGVAIDNYASVDFTDMQQIIDILGGVELTVTDEEVVYINGYLREINELSGNPQGSGNLPGGGTYLLNGRQALAYSRIRYIGTDFQRTQRQRNVLNAIIGKARALSTGELLQLSDQILPLVTHNLTPGDTVDLLTDLPSIINYEVVEQRIPYDGEYYSQNEILIPNDINATVMRLRSVIYAEQ